MIYVENTVEWLRENYNITKPVKKWHGNFLCNNNFNLTSLKGCSEIVYGDFYCNNNNLTSLEGCPKVVTKDFYCRYNPTKFVKEDVRKVCKVDGKVYV